MGRRGRPPKGLSHVDSLSGDPVAKERLKVILAAVLGEITVPEACRRIQVSASRFHQLRQQALEAMLQGLSPGPPGRPPREREDPEVRELRRQVAWLEEELEISRLRTEIALWKPSLLRDPVSPPPKKGGSSPRRKRRRRSDGGRSAT